MFCFFRWPSHQRPWQKNLNQTDNILQPAAAGGGRREQGDVIQVQAAAAIVGDDVTVFRHRVFRRQAYFVPVVVVLHIVKVSNVRSPHEMQ